MIYTSNLWAILKENFPFVDENSTHYLVRCPYCGDSRKHKFKAHLGISKDIPVFRCVRCEEYGHVSKLIYDVSGIRKRPGSILKPECIEKFNNYKEFKETKYKKINYKFPEQNFENFPNKWNYLNSRISAQNFLDDYHQNILFDLKGFIELNNINIEGKKQKLFEWFHNDFIGFTSFNKSLMVLRNTNEDSDFRYYLWKFTDVVNDFIMFDMLKKEKENISICISEGIFDIINLLTYEPEFDIYVVASGKLFKRAIKFAMINKCISYLNKLVIASDDDVHFNFYKTNLRSFKKISKNIQIWYNKNGKDFGLKTKVDKVILNMK